MDHSDIIIIGAGASGLMAAKTLAEAGKKVVVLEALNRYGGRTHTTLSKNGTTVEHGAEFVHGDLPLTLQLLKDAGIPYHKTTGRYLNFEGGKFEDYELTDDYLPHVMERMSKLKEDIDIKSFLEKEFPGDEHTELRTSTIAYVESYEAADADNTSTLALYHEWQQEQENVYRIEGGYGALMNSLYEQCMEAGCIFHFNSVVNSVHHKEGSVQVHTSGQQVFSAGKCIVTIPLGVLKLEQGSEDYIEFLPAINEKRDVARKIGFGTAIRLLFVFKEPFWEQYEKNMAFVFAREEVAVWWTQLPTRNNLLVGWVAGPRATAKKDLGDETLLQQGINSLAHIFSKTNDEIKSLLEEWMIANWANEPYSRGAYTYPSIDARRYKAILKAPVLDTLYFAGEGVYTGDAVGTVEAALVSGQEVAHNIL